MPPFASKFSAPLCLYLLAYLLMSALLTSCANTINYDEYLSSYAGMNEKLLIAIWGNPCQVFNTPSKETSEANTQTNLVFQHSEQINTMVSPAIYQPYFDGQHLRHRIVQPERWQLITRTCETIFVIQDQQVISCHYFGNGCLPPKQPQHPTATKNTDQLQ